MKHDSDNSNPPDQIPDKRNKQNSEGYPLYPADEDIYNRSEKEEDIDPENISRNKTPNENEEDGIRNEKDFDDDFTGDDLDVPGSELDDAEENIGNEDEENNYYSLGGDNHDDPEEDQGV